MKFKFLVSFVIFSLAMFVTQFSVYASSIFTEVQYISNDFDMFGYIHVQQLRSFYEKNGIDQKKLESLFDVNGSNKIDKASGKIFGSLIKSTQRVLFVAQSSKIDEKNEKVENLKSGYITFFELNAIPVDLQKYLNSLERKKYNGNMIYVFNEQEEVYGILNDKILIMGHKIPMSHFLKAKKEGIKVNAELLDKMRFDFSQTTAGLRIFLSTSLRYRMQQAMREGQKFGSGLDENVFFQALRNMRSISFSMIADDTLQYNMIMQGQSEEDGERLVMFNHFMIVSVSFIVPFFDMFSRSVTKANGNKPVQTAPQKLIYVQKAIGRIKTERIKHGVLVRFTCTEKEKKYLLRELLKSIEEQKIKMKEADRKQKADKQIKKDTVDVTFKKTGYNSYIAHH